MIPGRCMKCKKEVEMKDAQMVKTARGGFMAKGKCPECGSGTCRIRSKDQAEKDIESGDAKKAF